MENHFLITYIDSTSGDGCSIFPRVFRLSQACGPDDVTVPLRTIAFLFVKSSLSAKELQESIVGVELGNMVTLIHAKTNMKVESNLYCIGKEYCENGAKYIYNPRTKTRVASAYLKNYEVIDM